MQEYEGKFAELLDDQKLYAGFSEEIGKGHFFITIEEESEVMQTACRRIHTTSKSQNIPRNPKTSRPRGWIRSNTKMGPVSDVKIYPHEERYCIDIIIASFF